MKLIKFYLLILIPIIVFSQAGLDVTGRISIRTQNVDYDENSNIKPDSISNKEYGKTSLIPGIQHSMNLSLFGRMQNFDFTILSDIKNNQWNKFDISDFNSVERISINLRYVNHELILGDFYQSEMERFIKSREIRGFKYSTTIENLMESNSFLFLEALAGQSQPAFAVGSRLINIYKQFETVGQYRRLLGSSAVQFGKRGLFDISLRYLQGEDDKSSIQESLNPALQNRLYGAESNIYFWNRKVKLFADYFSSSKDTVDATSADDHSWTAGFDVRIDEIKFILLYQYIGFDYYTMGYPYLENDKEGIKSLTAYQLSKSVTLNADYEIYENNLLEDQLTPTTKTQILNAGFNTVFQNYPELTFNYGLRNDKSNEALSQDSLVTETNRFNQKFEVKLAYKINKSRFSMSASQINLDDNSQIGSYQNADSNHASLLGTSQFISNLNFYTQASQYLFISGGIVYSSLKLTNNQKNDNFYVYESNRWDIIPRKLKMESNITAIINQASNGGIQDYLSEYFQLNALLSLEYFFDDFVSLKFIAGTDTKNFNYSTEEALHVIANPDYGPTYFNGNESYNSWLIGGEFNYNF